MIFNLMSEDMINVACPPTVYLIHVNDSGCRVGFGLLFKVVSNHLPDNLLIVFHFKVRRCHEVSGSLSGLMGGVPRLVMADHSDLECHALKMPRWTNQG